MIGPGGASRVQASGKVYRLNRLSDFEGPYSEGTGQAGLATSGKAELWDAEPGGRDHAPDRRQRGRRALARAR